MGLSQASSTHTGFVWLIIISHVSKPTWQDRKPLAEFPHMPEDVMQEADRVIKELAQDEEEMNKEFLKAALFTSLS